MLFIDIELTANDLLASNPKLPSRLTHLFPPKKPTECWTYSGSKKAKYPMTKVKAGGRRRTVRWSRVICFIRDGDIPPAFEVAHLCQNKHCGNPNHLQALSKPLHTRLDRNYQFTKRAVEAAGCHFMSTEGRLFFSDVGPLGDDSNSEIAKYICHTLSIPVGLANRLVANDADIPRLVEQNQQQFPRLQLVLGGSVTS